MNDNRQNQDEYDVIQAKEEFESMLDPRTAALQERISILTKRIKELEAKVKELEGLQ